MLKRGFTLIELLIVVTVMTTLFSVGYANYRGYTRKQQFLGALRTLEGDIRLTQTMASSGSKASCVILKGYRFKIDTGMKSYFVIPVCEGADGIGVEAAAVKEVVLSDAVALMTVNGSVEDGILFFVLGRGTDLILDTPLEIILTQAGTAKIATMTVSAGGEISYVIE